MKSKITALALISAIALNFWLPCFAQTVKSSSYPAIIILKDGKSAKRKDVLIMQEEGFLKINGKKDSKITRSIPFSEIKIAEYSYSDKPQIKEAIGAALLTGGAWFFTLAFLFNKTKRHWLVVGVGDEPIFLELEKDSYRQLLLEMAASGIRVEDLGDKDAK